VNCWNKLADVAAQYVKKGSLVQVTTEWLRPSAWIDQSGAPQASLDLDANRLVMMYPINRTVKWRDYQWIGSAMRNSYSSEYKAKVVREVLREDKTLSQVAAAYGVHPNLVGQWRDQALSGLTGLFSRTKETDWAAKETAHEQEKQDLYAEIGRLTTQLSWLKKKAGKLVE